MSAQKPETNLQNNPSVEMSKLKEAFDLISKLDKLLVHESIDKYQLANSFYECTSHFRRCLRATIDLRDFSKPARFNLVLKDKLIKPLEHPGYLLFKEILPNFIPGAYEDNSVFKTVADNLGHSERIIFQMLTGLTSVNIIVALKLEAWLGKDVVCSKKLMALQTQYDLEAYRDKAQLKIVPFGTKTKSTGYSDEPYQSK